LRRDIKNPKWKQQNLKGKWEPLCAICANRRLRNPFNGLLNLKKIDEPTEDKAVDEVEEAIKLEISRLLTVLDATFRIFRSRPCPETKCDHVNAMEEFQYFIRVGAERQRQAGTAT